MQNPIARNDRISDTAALSAARGGWGTTLRYALILLVARGVPWVVVLAVASLVKQVLS